MSKLDCHQKFLEGQQRREPHVLRRGVYKLEEMRLQYDPMIDDVRQIIKYKSGITIQPRLICCTTEDMAVWLKKAPGDVAFDLGYYLLPAVAALTGDSVPGSTVDSMTTRFRHLARHLVNSCQAAHVAIKRSIAIEYRRMRYGESYVLPLLLQAQALFHVAIVEAEHCGSCAKNVEP